MSEQIKPVLDWELAALLGVECANFGDLDPDTGRPFIDQLGVKPGDRKLAQFRRAFALRNTPQLYATEDIPADDKIVTVKLFNPCGSESWYFSEFSLKAPDGYPDLGFSYVTGMFEDEWGYTSLAELANLKGPTGIGIEIDCWFKPVRFKDLMYERKRHLEAESETL